MSINLPAELPDPQDREANEEAASGFWRKIRRVAGRIPFAEEAVAAWYCTRDPATPPHVRAVLIAALAYFVIPTDALPDFLPAIGYADDAALFWAVWNMMRKYITADHRERAAQALDAEDFRE